MQQFVNYLDEGAADSALKKKSEASGVSLATLKTVYKRGVAAWNSGHRPGTTPQQWGMARVNSYITKGKGTYHGADKDLREEESMIFSLEEAIGSIDKGEYDYEGDMSRTQLQTIMRSAQELIDKLKANDNMPEWVQAKITKAEDYISSVRDYLMSREELEEAESCEAGYKRRVVKTTKPEHKEDGYEWRIKGKERPEISIKLYKEKPSQSEFNKQMRRVAGHEFGEEYTIEDSRADNRAYHKGVSDSTARARVAHWKKMDKLSDRDPRSYEPAPGDATAKTKESVHTKKYREMYGEESMITFVEYLKEERVAEAVKGWKHAGRDLMKSRQEKSDAAKEVRLVSLKKDGTESKMHDAEKRFNSEDEARQHHERVKKLNPNRAIAHNLYVGDNVEKLS